MTLINTMPHGIYQQLLIQTLAKKIDINPEEIHTLIDNDSEPTRQPPQPSAQPSLSPERANPTEAPANQPPLRLSHPLDTEMLACCILTHSPAYIHKIDPSIFDEHFYERPYWLNTILQLITATQATSTGQLLQHCAPSLQPHITQMAQVDVKTQPEHLVVELNGALAKIKHQCVQNKINSFIRRSKNTPLSAQEQAQLKNLLHIKSKE